MMTSDGESQLLAPSHPDPGDTEAHPLPLSESPPATADAQLLAAPAQPPEEVPPDPPHPNAMPWWPPVLLVLAVLSVSSAGPVMKSVTAAAPVALSSWRLQATSLVLLPGFCLQIWLAGGDLRSRLTSPPVVLTLLVSSVALAAHFGLWVYSLTATSLPHSLLFVSTPPLILAVYSLATGSPLARGELVGLAIGAAGVVLVAASAASERDVTILGDAAAFGAAVAFAVYVTVAKGLRSWLPLYIFALPVTACAALLLAAVAAVQGAIVPRGPSSNSAATSSMQVSSSEGATVYIGFSSGVPPHSEYNPFAWVFLPYLLPVLYLAFGPGFVGHTGLNAVLRYMSPLTIAMAITSEPPLGSLLGWLMGQTEAPGVLTWIGGTLLVVATVWVGYAEDVKEEMEQVSLSKGEQAAGPQETDGMMLRTTSDRKAAAHEWTREFEGMEDEKGGENQRLTRAEP